MSPFDNALLKIEQLSGDKARLEMALSASVGYLLNAKIDLETGCSKATAVKTIEGGIAKARAALALSDQPLVREGI